MTLDIARIAGAKEEAERFLRAHLLAPSALTVAERVALLRPRPEDWEALFGARAAAVEEAYGSLWERPMLPGPKAGQTVLTVTVASAELLGADHSISRRFPGGFLRVAPSLPADSLWATWKFTAPGSSAGMVYDGLCQRGPGRWAWFPKLWRALPP